jgi:hypothetical protein
MSKLRLDYFLSLGGEFVAKDRVLRDYGEMTFDSDTARNMNNYTGAADIFVTHFELRENTGSQPCGDGVPIATCWDVNDNVEIGLAGNFDFAIDIINITTWKPDIEALIKMQNEHDANELKLNHGIEKAADEAERVISAISESINKTEASVYTQAMKDAGELPVVGMWCLMKHHGKMGKAIVVAITNIFIIFESYGIERVRKIDGLSIEPIDSRTQKQKQLDKVAARLSQFYFELTNVRSEIEEFEEAAECLQDDNLLYEIIQPLEK